MVNTQLCTIKYLSATLATTATTATTTTTTITITTTTTWGHRGILGGGACENTKSVSSPKAEK